MDSLQIQSLTGGRDGIRILKLQGPFTLQFSLDFQSIAREPNAPPVTIIDLTDVPYMDSAALGCILGVHVSCQREGRSVRRGRRFRSLEDAFQGSRCRWPTHLLPVGFRSRSAARRSFFKIGRAVADRGAAPVPGCMPLLAAANAGPLFRTQRILQDWPIIGVLSVIERLLEHTAVGDIPGRRKLRTYRLLA